ncbi:hypothetical protein INR49_002296 [Caranx melampygus]|nr:hypothetical protein INR49_002296 [Caranx melampygus]
MLHVPEVRCEEEPRPYLSPTPGPSHHGQPQPTPSHPNPTHLYRHPLHSPDPTLCLFTPETTGSTAGGFSRSTSIYSTNTLPSTAAAASASTSTSTSTSTWASCGCYWRAAG